MAFFYLLHYNADTFTKGTHNKRTTNPSVRQHLIPKTTLRKEYV